MILQSRGSTQFKRISLWTIRVSAKTALVYLSLSSCLSGVAYPAGKKRDFIRGWYQIEWLASQAIDQQYFSAAIG